MVKLGDKVKDRVSGFKGVAVAEHKYLHGYVRITVQPPMRRGGKLPESRTFDAPQLKIVKPRQTSTGTIKPGWLELRPDVGSYQSL